jgi:hypothetical protein
MLLLIDIFSINKGRGYEKPSLEIIVTEHCSTGGCPLEEAREHCFLNQSAISVVVLISFLCYCGDYVVYITVILPFLAFYFCSAYFLYLVYYIRCEPTLTLPTPDIRNLLQINGFDCFAIYDIASFHFSDLQVFRSLNPRTLRSASTCQP